MHELELKGHLMMLGYVAQVAMGIPAQEIADLYSHNDAIGPLIDPTGWMKHRDEIAKNQRGIHALLAFQKEIGEIWPEFKEGSRVADAT